MPEHGTGTRSTTLVQVRRGVQPETRSRLAGRSRDTIAGSGPPCGTDHHALSSEQPVRAGRLELPPLSGPGPKPAGGGVAGSGWWPLVPSDQRFRQELVPCVTRRRGPLLAVPLAIPLATRRPIRKCLIDRCVWSSASRSGSREACAGPAGVSGMTARGSVELWPTAPSLAPERSEHAELVAVGIDEDNPRLLSLTDVDSSRLR